MILTLTSNTLEVESIKSIQEDYILCLSYNYPNLLKLSKSNQLSKVNNMNMRIYHFDIIHDIKTPVSDMYQSEDNLVFNFHPVNTFSEAVEKIVDLLNSKYQKELNRDEDNRDEISLAVCCSYPWTQQMVNLISSRLEDINADIACQNLYRTLKQPSTKKMTSMLNSFLNTDKVVSADPVTFGYAIQIVLGGMF